ncbi:hypothetical protein L6452_06144 [Arctium lappa]|uniref:Uncharacterized protein n=1 Tax=Arctium lappa TaxID=4217 RepID=A0ACB9EJE2_ARCLA|nr:hypothetical protein L6452_06144 [Arctium lappa]
MGKAAMGKAAMGVVSKIVIFQREESRRGTGERRLRDKDLHSAKLFFQSQNLDDEDTSMKRGDKGQFFNKTPLIFNAAKLFLHQMEVGAGAKVRRMKTPDL